MDIKNEGNDALPQLHDLREMRKYIVSTLIKKGALDFENRAYCGFKRCQILEMSERPELYGKKILQLSDYMYLHSGYYKRLIDYFANQAIFRYTIDTRLYSDSADISKIREQFMKFSADAQKFNLDREIHNILRRMYRDDVVFAYIVETKAGYSYFYLNPMMCEISGIAAGGVYTYCINTNWLSPEKLQKLPAQLIREIQTKRDKTGRYYVPAEKSLCLKYNNDYLYPYPPFFSMIADILLIDEYKELAKAQSINDAYKLLTMKIPTKDGNITLDDNLITAFTSVVLDTVQNNIGVVTTPFEMKTEEFSSSNADDRDTVSDTISWAFKNVGVSEALMSGASTGSELKLSITNDSGDIFRLYRMIEQQVALWLKLKRHNYDGYEFTYSVLDMTIFNKDDFIKTELSAAQNGLPDKFRLCAAHGSTPAQTLGNNLIENNVFATEFGAWMPLKTSYTQSANGDVGGRPVKDDDDIAEITERQRDNDSNSTDNRI